MSVEPIRNEVRYLLASTNAEIAEAEETMARGEDVSRTRAAGALVYLRFHKAELEARMADLNRAHDTMGVSFVQWIKESWMILIQQAQAWLVMH